MTEPKKEKPIYLRLANLVSDYSLPKSTVYYLIKTQGFPKQIQIADRTVIWRRDDVEAWIAEREAMGQNHE